MTILKNLRRIAIFFANVFLSSIYWVPQLIIISIHRMISFFIILGCKNPNFILCLLELLGNAVVKDHATYSQVRKVKKA